MSNFSSFFPFFSSKKSCHSSCSCSNPTSVKKESDTVTFDNFLKIVVILDESGSMDVIRNDMIKSINSFVKEQKQIKGKPATFTLIKFNGSINRVIKNKNLNEIEDLNNNDYVPNGNTALYDCIGDTINWFRNEKDVLLVVVTDGMDNASRTYNKYQVMNSLDEKRKTNNWSYVYLSNDLTTVKQGDDLGFKNSSFASNCYVDTAKYGDFVSRKLNSAVSNYRQYNLSVQSQLN